ncbi:MAG: Trp biosynthesis-associated membrane protein [Nocardioides sp.]
MPEPRRTFAPVLLLGLAAGTLSAVAGTKPWAQVTDSNAAGSTADWSMSFDDVGQMPVAGALSLVVLASWGVVLVTRGWVRRAVTVLGAAAALGVLLAVVIGYSSTQEDVADSVRQIGATSVEVAPTGWYWAAVVSSVLSLVATVLAVRYVRSWPAMGSRYDAPSARPAPTVDLDEPADGELWRAIDEGHDPTA